MSVLPHEIAPMSRRIPAEPARSRRAPAYAAPAFPAVRLLGVVLIAAFTWRAVHTAGASGAQLLLPLLVEAGVSLILIGAARAFWPGGKEASARVSITMLRLFAVVAAGLLLSQLVLALNADEPFQLAALGSIGAALDHLQGAGMARPMIVALVLGGAASFAVLRRPREELVPALRSLGLRGLLVCLLCPLIFLAFTGEMRAQLVWLSLLIAELFAFWMPWALQWRLAETEEIDLDDDAPARPGR